MTVVAAPRVALSALSFHLPQDQICKFLDDCRRRFALSRAGEGETLGAECWTTLVVDEWDGVYDLARLATHVDVLSFGQRRRGFGVARATALQEARISQASWTVVVDADGQHDAAAIARLLQEAEASEWDAVIPQRTLIDLPLLDEGDIDRKLAERFEAWVIARASARDDLARLDMQPGLFLLNRRAVDLLLERTRSRAYEWDLESTWHLLGSDLRLAFPSIETRPQATTFFATEDSLGLLRFLRTVAGAERVQAELGIFRAQEWVKAEFSDAALDLLSRHVAEALSTPEAARPA